MKAAGGGGGGGGVYLLIAGRLVRDCHLVTVPLSVMTVRSTQRFVVTLHCSNDTPFQRSQVSTGHGEQVRLTTGMVQLSVTTVRRI